MRRPRIYFFAAFILLACVSLRVSSQQQAEERSSVLIRNADVVRSFNYNGNTINRLLGNVIIEQERNGVVVTCDSAYMYTSDSLDLFSQIEMFQGASTIRCDKMTYDDGWARVRGNIVRMHRDGMTLLTQYFDYSLDQELGIYFNGGTVDRAGELLESDRGYYYAQPDLFMFAGNVALKNEEYIVACDTMQYNMTTEDIQFLGPTKIWKEESFLSANYGWQKKTIDEIFFTDDVYICTPDNELWTDSLYYYQAEERGLLYGNIQTIDTVQSIMTFGDEGRFFNDPEFVEFYKNPSVLHYSEREDNEQNIAQEDTAKEPIADDLEGMQPLVFNKNTVIDTLFVVADTIRSVAYPNPALHLPQDSVSADQPVDSVYRQIYAYRNVRAFRYNLQSVCDSMVFNTHDSIARMYVEPVIWSDTTQISSDSIHITMRNGVIETADFYSSPFIAMREDSIRFNQIKGRNMKAFFIDNAIDRLEVYGNAQNIYYLREDDEIENVNISESANMTVYFLDSKVRRVKYDFDTDSKIYPIDQQPEEGKTLKGMNWQEARRPKSREELFTRHVHPSQRIQTQSYTLPVFSITQRLLEIEKNSWVHEKVQEEVSMPLAR